jgi:hypothetical protein
MTLSVEDAAIVKGLLARKERQHDIAAYFGVNGGRIAEIATGAKFADVKPAPKKDLPTPAVLTMGYAAHVALQTLSIIEVAVASARERILAHQPIDPRKPN